MSNSTERIVLLVAAFLMIWMALTSGAPSPPPDAASQNALERENTTSPPKNDTYEGIDHRQRKKNVTNPCSDNDEYQCVFFILCHLGTLKTYPNGMAYRGPNYANHCDFFDDACCKPDMELIEEYVSRNNSIKLEIPRS